MVCIINRSYDTSLFKFQKQSEWFCILMGIILTPRYSSIFAKSYNHVGQYQSLPCFTFDATNHSLAVRFPSLWLLAKNPPMYCYVHPALLQHVSDTYADSVCVCQFCHFYLPQSDIHFNWIQFNSHPWVSGVVQDRKKYRMKKRWIRHGRVWCNFSLNSILAVVLSFDMSIISNVDRRL